MLERVVRVMFGMQCAPPRSTAALVVFTNGTMRTPESGAGSRWIECTLTPQVARFVT